ncbi:MAG: alpha/beta hydrolase [Clostridia bacterium]|nr:alpha/beta hydrolase [Clostridia bacterium]
MSDKNSFIHQTEFFASEFEVHAFDFKGFGENKGMDFPYSLDDYVNELVEFCKTNGIVKPHVLAHSFGARVALKTTYRYPDFFDKMVLTGAAGLKSKATLKKSCKKIAFKLLKRIVPREKLKCFYSPDYLALDEIMRQSFVKIVNEHLDYTLPFIKNRTLLIFGKNDKETPLYMARKLNNGIKNSKLLILEDAGHFAFIDKSIKFNLEMREFLLSKD